MIKWRKLDDGRNGNSEVARDAISGGSKEGHVHGADLSVDPSDPIERPTTKCLVGRTE